MKDSLSLVDGLNSFSVDLISLCVGLRLSDNVLDLVLIINHSVAVHT